MNRATIARVLDGNLPALATSLRRARKRLHRYLARGLIARERRTILEQEPWQIDGIAFSGSEVEVAGWLLRSPGGGETSLTLNGLPSSSLRFFALPDLEERFWHRIGARDIGFVATWAAPEGLFARSYARLSWENAPTSPGGGLKRDYFLLDPAREAPLPSGAQRSRVLGNASEFGFLLTGATDFNRLDAAVRMVERRPLASFDSVLDWGVGCGRLARYASREIDPQRFHGCDIDEENVAWCRSHLRGSFSHTSVRPPLPFGPGGFDVVYGVSVFTHLRESLQDEWLAELRRVLRPGGLALVTTHGQTALDFGGSEPGDYAALRESIAREGIVVTGRNSDLDGAVASPEEYVNVFHGDTYVRRHWSRWFDVAAIVPGYIYTHDLIVLRRRDD